MTLEELKESGQAESNNRKVYYINVGTPTDEEVEKVILELKNK